MAPAGNPIGLLQVSPFVLSGSLALEALLIGVYSKKRYIMYLDTIQYNTLLLR